MSFLRDPAWGFVAVVIALAAIGIAWWQRRRKELSFEVVALGPIVTVYRTPNNVATEAIEIRYNGTPVHDVQLVEVRLRNSGNEPVVESDYRASVAISFGGQLLAADSVESVPATLKEGAITVQASQPDRSLLLLRPVLLNQRDSITIQALLTNFNGDIKVDGHIVGVPSIRRAVRPRRAPLPLRVYVVMFAVLAVVAAGMVFLTVPGPSVPTVLFGTLVGTIVLFGSIFIMVRLF